MTIASRLTIAQSPFFDIGGPTCELVDANVAVCGISVSNSQINFTSVIVMSVESNLRRRSVFPSLCLAQVFIL